METYTVTRLQDERTIGMVVRLLTEMGATMEGDSDMLKLFGYPTMYERSRRQNTTIASQHGQRPTSKVAHELRAVLGDPDGEVCHWVSGAQRSIFYAVSVKGDRAVGTWGPVPRNVNRDYFDNNPFASEVLEKTWPTDGEPLDLGKMQKDWERAKEELADSKEWARSIVMEMLVAGDPRVKLSASGNGAVLLKDGKPIGRCAISTEITPENVNGIHVDVHIVEEWVNLAGRVEEWKREAAQG